LPELSAPGVWARLIAGSAYGLRNTVKTFSPQFYLHAELDPGAKLALPADHAERAVYVISGAISHEGSRYSAGKLLVFTAGGEPVVTAEDERARLMLLGGANIGPRFI
jgi:hypothetical protein